MNTNISESIQADRRRARKREYAKGFDYKYTSLKSSAKRRGLEMLLSIADYIVLTINGKCSYCEEPLPSTGHGIDRINNSLGYVKENCIPCCDRCNNRKGRLEALGFKYPRTVELLKELLTLE